MAGFSAAKGLNAYLKNTDMMSVLNFLGLFFALTAAVLLAALVRFDFAFDRAVDPAGQVFTLYTKSSFGNNPPVTLNGTNKELAAAIRAAYEAPAPAANLEATTQPAAGSDTGVPFMSARVSSENFATVRVGAESLDLALYSADPSFAQMFEVNTLYGNLQAALQTPDTVALTEEKAITLFGRANVVGETLELGGTKLLRVGAVLANWPKNVRFSGIEALISSTNSLSSLNLGSNQGPTVTASSSLKTYIKPLRPLTGREQRLFEARISQIASQQLERMLSAATAASSSTRTTQSEVVALRLLDAYFTPVEGELQLSNPWRGDLPATAALAVIAGLVILVAALNFINLSTSNAYRRTTEAAVMRAFGMLPRQIVAGQLVRYGLLGTCAGVLAVGAAWLLRDWFSELTGRTILFDPIGPDSLYVILFSSLVGTLAGILPALMVARLPLHTALNARENEVGGAAVLRSILVIFQGCATVLVIALVGVVNAQLTHVTEDALGFDDEGLEIYNLPAGAYSRDLKRTLADLFSKEADIEAFSLSNAVPLTGQSQSARANLASEDVGANTPSVQVTIADVDAQYFDVYGVSLLAGRAFYESEVKSYRLSAANTVRPIILSEQAARSFGFAAPADAIGQIIKINVARGWTAEVVGVAPDMPVAYLRSDTVAANMYSPQVIDASLLTVKLNPAAISSASKRLAAIMTELHAEKETPTHFFAEQRVAQEYASLHKLLNLVTFFALLAVVFCATGVVGLAAAVAYRMTREASIRKVFGAGSLSIAGLILVRVIGPIFAGGIIAGTLTQPASTLLLDGYSKTISVTLAYPALAALLILGVSFLAVQFHVIRIAAIKPVDALRYE